MFCEKRDILIKYAAPYMHKENGLVKQKWCTIIIIKDSMLISSKLSH